MPRIRALTAGVTTAVLLAVPVAATAAAPHAHAAKKPIITMSGSTSVAPLASKLAKAYIKHHNVGFKLAQGGSDIGVADVAAGRVSIGNSSRDPKPTDPGGLIFSKIARDAICLTTNPDNKLPNLSQQQVQDIFSGTIRDWGDVPGATTSGPIDLIVRTNASGTQDAFQKLFMGTVQVATSAAQKASNGLVAQSIKTDKNAIGYLSQSFTPGLNNAAYKGIACTLPNAKSGQYEGARNFWMVTNGLPTGPVLAWIKWIQHNPAAQKIIASEWVPLS
jgi:phosphate transport system substrate-binding protein